MTKVAISEEYLTDIADSIREKLDTQDTYKVSQMSEAIDSIETGGGGLDWTALGYSGMPQFIVDDYDYSLSVKNNWDGVSSFINNSNIVYLPLMDFSGIPSDANSFFSGCANLMYIPAININSTSYRYMFNNCYYLRDIDLSNFVTTNATRMDAMFSGCSKLKELDLSSFYTPNLTRVQNMFNGCTSLEKIDMRNFSLSQITTSSYYTNMFTSVPNNCLIIVKDNTEKSWITSKFTNLTNVKTVDEYNAM